MATYLLLRDNKQSGPYTFDELKQKGLKAYDLVWVDGKSAAWRYPGEVEELKPFSPEVVEQPFDRFFRRPSQQESKTLTGTTSRQAEPVEKEVIPVQQAVIQAGSRNIYVTLPASVRKSPQREYFASEEPAKAENFPKETVKQEFVRQIIPQAVSVADEFYPQSERPTAIDSSIKKNSKSDMNWQKPVLAISAVLILLGVGIFIGLFISRTSPNNSLKNFSSIVGEKNSVASQQGNPVISIPVSAHVVDQKETPAGPQDNVNGFIPPSQTADKKLVATNIEKKKTVVPKEKTDNIQKIALVIPSEEPATDPSTAAMPRRDAVHRDDVVNDKEKEAGKAALLTQISIGANKYTVGTFGGISALQLTLSNRSSHALDLVVVEVQYVQANKKIFKTENIYFKNVNAGAAIMQEAPKSPRGIKVQYKITVINSKDPGVSYSGM